MLDLEPRCGQAFQAQNIELRLACCLDIGETDAICILPSQTRKAQSVESVPCSVSMNQVKTRFSERFQEGLHENNTSLDLTRRELNLRPFRGIKRVQEIIAQSSVSAGPAVPTLAVFRQRSITSPKLLPPAPNRCRYTSHCASWSRPFQLSNEVQGRDSHSTTS